MSEELICITCPRGCHLSIERDAKGEFEVSGNRCPRGAAYAREELTAPKRTVTATAKLAGCEKDFAGYRPRRVPVRTVAPIPKEKIGELLAAVYALEVRPPVARGAVLIKDALGTGVDVIATRSIS
jgi:CxxC motif-containing protein